MKFNGSTSTASFILDGIFNFLSIGHIDFCASLFLEHLISNLDLNLFLILNIGASTGPNSSIFLTFDIILFINREKLVDSSFFGEEIIRDINLQKGGKFFSFLIIIYCSRNL